jgi:hypothetical protein
MVVDLTCGLTKVHLGKWTDYSEIVFALPEKWVSKKQKGRPGWDGLSRENQG